VLPADRDPSLPPFPAGHDAAPRPSHQLFLVVFAKNRSILCLTLLLPHFGHFVRTFTCFSIDVFTEKSCPHFSQW